jgi:hypothetical protein
VRGGVSVRNEKSCWVFKGSVEKFNSLQCIINVFSDHKTKCLCHMTKERYKPQMNKGRLTYIATCIQCRLDTLLNLPFKSIFELCYRKQGSCLVFIRGISECYISRLTHNLDIIFRVPIRNTIIKNGQYWKRHIYKILP